MEYLTKYPRPDFLRSNWVDLNGLWEFDFDDEDIGEEKKWFIHHEFLKTILVPFVYQSEMSGIGCREAHDIMWYGKRLTVGEEHKGKCFILNFGAVDYHAKIWFNGCYAGEHYGGYSPFQLDITGHIKFGKENIIIIKVVDDSYSKEQPRGKQMWLDKPYGCWYTRYSGVWQPVWINILDKVHITSFKITPDIDTKKVNMNIRLSDYTEYTKFGIKITFDGLDIANGVFSIRSTSLEVDFHIANSKFQWGIALWDIDNPNLYDVEFTVFENERIADAVGTYFGMRSISIREDKILLNGNLFYQKLVLNQCHYPGTYITPKDEETIIKDIKAIKELGFNGVRIHEKIEDPRYLYWCDRLGLVVWEEMPSVYQFSHLSMECMLSEWVEVMNRDYNHPCIITWVLFNESWGVENIRHNTQEQAFTKSLYYLTKAFDQTRLVIGNDGWEHTETDICTIHDYSMDGERIKKVYQDSNIVLKSAPAPLYARFIFCDSHSYKGQPVMMSEYGGISLETDDGWGYNSKAKDENEFINRFTSLTCAIKQLDYVCGYCYTQLTDAEHEKNGLLTLNRVFKVNPEKIRQINEL